MEHYACSVSRSARRTAPLRALPSGALLEREPGRDERLLYHLQRHSDHHANPTRRYQAPARLP